MGSSDDFSLDERFHLLKALSNTGRLSLNVTFLSQAESRLLRQIIVQLEDSGMDVEELWKKYNIV